MKRDMDLIRIILTLVEDCSDSDFEIERSTPPGQLRNFEWSALKEHVLLMAERNLVDVVFPYANVVSIRLTWEGHEFLDNSRSPEVWNATKAAAGHLSFSTFASVLSHLAINHGLGLLKSGYEGTVSAMGGL